MNWNWQTIKDQAAVIYGKGAQVLLFLGACFYLLACVVAAKPLGAKNYVGFVNYCFQ